MKMSHDRLSTDSPRSHHVYSGWKNKTKQKTKQQQQQHAMSQSCLVHLFDVHAFDSLKV